MNVSPLRLLAVALLSPLCLFLAACGGGATPSIITSPGYAITAPAFSPSSINAGSTATTTVTVSSQAGYFGTVTLSCAAPTGGGMPAPTCSFATNPVSVTATSAATSVLTVSTTASTPNANYELPVSGSDTGGAAPANGGTNLALTTVGKIQHIVILFQENRTPDNLFQDPNLIAAGADIASSGLDSSGDKIPLQPTPLGIDYDLSHLHSAFTEMCDLNLATNVCQMDGANLIKVTCSAGATNCPPANAQFFYVQQSDVQPYWDMAEQYTFADHMFQTNQGPSFPAHQFLISGTSEPSAGSNLFVADNPLGVANSSADTGCTSPPNEYVAVINAEGSENSNPTIYPCFEHTTLTDEMNSAGITWRYYAPIAGSIWTAPNAIEHMCGPNVPPPNATSCTGSDWTNNVSLNTADNAAPILTDIAAGDLQQVSWVIPTESNSDHAGSTTTTGGPSWVASIVNAIAASSYWSNTAIVVAWDDWGGWYDHVPPPKIVDDGVSWGSGYVYGFRVPLLVISPYAQPAYISKVDHDFGSILNFVENNFGLAQLGFADSHASDDLSDCFNFDQTPLVHKKIKAPIEAEFFIHDKRPPVGPDND